MKVFGRDPALWLAFVAGLVQLVSAFFLPLSDAQQGVLNAVAVAGLGLITAWAVARDKLVPAIMGAVQALLSLAVTFGAGLSGEQQFVIMSFVAATVGMFVRTQVTAKVPEEAMR